MAKKDTEIIRSEGTHEVTFVEGTNSASGRKATPQSKDTRKMGVIASRVAPRAKARKTAMPLAQPATRSKTVTKAVVGTASKIGWRVPVVARPSRTDTQAVGRPTTFKIA